MFRYNVIHVAMLAQKEHLGNKVKCPMCGNVCIVSHDSSVTLSPVISPLTIKTKESLPFKEPAQNKSPKEQLKNSPFHGAYRVVAFFGSSVVAIPLLVLLGILLRFLTAGANESNEFPLMIAGFILAIFAFSMWGGLEEYLFGRLNARYYERKLRKQRSCENLLQAGLWLQKWAWSTRDATKAKNYLKEAEKFSSG